MGSDDAAEAALLRELVWWWEVLDRELFDGRGRRPVITLERMSDLGRWAAEPRTLTLGWALVVDRPWLEVVEVLKHEMAHQYVHEVLGVRDEPAHGPTFRRVCRDRGIDPRAVGAPATEGQRGLLRRVQKLLALAGSPNEHEARAALAAATRLLDQEGIDGVSVGDVAVVVRQVGEIRARTPRHEQLLAGVLAGWFDVAVVWVPAWDVRTSRRGRVLEVVGRAERVEVAEHVHAFLLATGERLWRAHRASAGVTSDRERRRFLEGVMLGFRDTLEAAPRPRGGGLVRVADGAVVDLFERRHPHLRRGRRMRLALDEARAAGRSAGQGIQVRPALRGGRTLELPGPKSGG